MRRYGSLRDGSRCSCGVVGGGRIPIPNQDGGWDALLERVARWKGPWCDLNHGLKDWSQYLITREKLFLLRRLRTCCTLLESPRVAATFWQRTSLRGCMRALLHRVWLHGTAGNQGGCGGGISAWIGIAMLVLAATRAVAAVHPVPLDPKVDSAKCLECHEDKTKGKSVHSAMA